MTARARNRPAGAGVVIAGGGLAGQRACEALRRNGYDGPIRVIAAERHRPYDRPPLSKDYLAGTLEDAALPLRPRDWYADHDVDLLLGHRAVRLDPIARTLTTSQGDRLRYEQLLIATGSTPRRLPIAAGHDNLHELRTLDDARALRDALTPGTRLAIIGAGFVGQEVAATASALGARVTLIEAAEAPLARLLGADLGRWFARFHREQASTSCCPRASGASTGVAPSKPSSSQTGG